MKIIVSQNGLPAGRQGKKLLVKFPNFNIGIDKSEDFLACVDKFLKKRDNLKNTVAKADLEFIGTGMLTERIIRAIIAGLRL